MRIFTAKEANCQGGETHLYFEFTEMEPGLTKSMAPSGNFTLKTKASVRLITYTEVSYLNGAQLRTRVCLRA